MPAPDAPALTCRLAACRENRGDGKEWSLYVLNDTPVAVEAVLAHVSYEWGDRGHSVTPGVDVHLAPGAYALLWREGWEGAEMSMEVSVRLRSAERQASLLFELGKLYRRRAPVHIEAIGTLGWLQTATPT